MTRASEVFNQQDGGLTQSYYAQLNSRGPAGQIAVALMRAQKRSSRAKDYRPGKYRRAAYDVKAWSMGEVCRLLTQHGEALGFKWGWKQDSNVRFGEEASWVLYVDVPSQGQVSFHSPTRGSGPEYEGFWDGEHKSTERILAYCDTAMLLEKGERSDDLALRTPLPVEQPSQPLRFGDPNSIAAARHGRRSYGPRRAR